MLKVMGGHRGRIRRQRDEDAPPTTDRATGAGPMPGHAGTGGTRRSSRCLVLPVPRRRRADRASRRLHDNNSFLTPPQQPDAGSSKTGSIPSARPSTRGRPTAGAWTVQSWGRKRPSTAASTRSFGAGPAYVSSTRCSPFSLVLADVAADPPGPPGFPPRSGRVPAGIRHLHGHGPVGGAAVAVRRPSPLALVPAFAADDGLDPRWLVPVMWIWVKHARPRFPVSASACSSCWPPGVGSTSGFRTPPGPSSGRWAGRPLGNPARGHQPPGPGPRC